ncbi:MAG: hypothetical protein J2P13_04895 [Acidobacteria bacterium]|nr:hypothetical protein [Acidobacteriota bacterium]
MAIQLGWEDLLIGNVPRNESERWLGYWSGWITGRVLPLYMSMFGDWLLRHQDGSTSELSVIEGSYSRIASTPDEFLALVNSREWQEEHLLSLIVYELHERNIIPAQGQCYGFAPHPRLSGRLDINQATTMEIGAWQAICAATTGLDIGTAFKAGSP